jgi:hypothetical protein
MTQAQNRKEFEVNLITKAWQDDAFKQELIANPRAVYQSELGQSIPENLQIKVLEENSNTLYLIVPQKPEVSEELSEEALEQVAGGGRYMAHSNKGGGYIGS